MHNRNLVKTATMWLLFLNAFIIETEFRVRAFTDKTIDFQVLLKLGLWTVSLLFSLYVYRLWIKKLVRIDNFFLLLLLIDILISCIYSPNPTYSLGCAFSLVAVLFLLLMASAVLSNREILQPFIYGCTLVAAISIVFYYAFPDMGRMKEWVGANLLPGKRLSGITGTANTIGYISALCLVSLYYYRGYLPQRPRVFSSYSLFVLINLVALWMSNSRTSMAALVISICAAAFMRPTSAKLAALFLGICCAILFFLAIDTNDLFAALARSGDASEIESGTGRTAIWRVAFKLISEKPLLGWGYSASTYLLPAHRYDVGFSVNQVHNAMLQCALSVGMVGLGLFVSVLLIKLYYSIKSGEQLNVAFTVFLLIDGLTEPIAFSGVATTTTLALSMVLALNYREDTPGFSMSSALQTEV